MQSLRPASSPRSLRNLDEGAACGTRQGSRGKKDPRIARPGKDSFAGPEDSPSVAMFDRLKPLGNCKDREE